MTNRTIVTRRRLLAGGAGALGTGVLPGKVFAQRGR